MTRDYIKRSGSRITDDGEITPVDEISIDIPDPVPGFNRILSINPVRGVINDGLNITENINIPIERVRGLSIYSVLKDSYVQTCKGD